MAAVLQPWLDFSRRLNLRVPSVSVFYHRHLNIALFLFAMGDLRLLLVYYVARFFPISSPSRDTVERFA